ncbi:MAG: cytochrome c oxidase subunit II [Arenicella sp.]
MSLLAMSNMTQAAYEYNLPEQVTEIGREITALHNLIFVICLVILILVSGAMFYSIYAHRKSRGVEAATFSHSTKLEVIWTVIPVIILIVMAVPATQVLIKQEDTTKSDLTLKVTGYQWKWQYEYLDNGIDFYSTLTTPREQIDQFSGKVEQGVNYLQEVDNHVVIPSGKKVRLLLTANDVIHAWWVPKLGGKKDAIPGYITEMWIRADVGAEGTYRGRCAELCGKDHAYMPIVVDVVTQEEYEQWVAVNAEAASHEIKNVADIQLDEMKQPQSERFVSQKVKPIESVDDAQQRVMAN